MERTTRKQMVAEFGEPGVENPAILDLITHDAALDAVVLAMIERRPWGASPAQLTQIEEKINRYLAYALDGFLAEHYPHYEGRRVIIRLDCAEEPHGDAVKFVAAARDAIERTGIGFLVNVTPPA